MIRYFWPSDDEQLAGQWQDSHFDEDASFWVSVQKAGATIVLAAALLVGASTTQAAVGVFSQVQDDPAGSLINQPAVQEEYWQNPTPPVNWPQPSVITYDDTHVAFVQTFTPDDGDNWHQLVQPVQASNYIQLPFLDPEEIPVGSFSPVPNPVDDSAVWAPQIPQADPDFIISVFLDDGSWVPALEPDEDFLPTSALPAPYNWPQPAQAISTSDEDQLVIQFVAAEDPRWLQLVPPIPGSLLWPQQWAFEQHEPSGNLFSFTEEPYWQNPTPPVPATIWLLRQDQFEQNDATGALFLDLDEGLPGPLPAPLPAGNLLLQQWPFDTQDPAGGFSIIHEEDLWANWVQPIASWPVPAIYTAIQGGWSDDVIPPAQTTVLDELYFNWLVAPVPATLGGLYGRALYLPEPEEIPAGSLVPFVPPPVVPCVMPAGLDADTNVSTFSNFKGGPIMVLFCRLCMSGRPLLVRGDYAIWCQDCCSFVSKQDTFMGTVKAPGQFRARF